METTVTCELARSLSEMIIGENPTRIEHHWQRLFRAHRNIRGGGLMVHTISAIDMALWDIAGKLWGRTGVSPARWVPAAIKFGNIRVRKRLKRDREVLNRSQAPPMRLLIWLKRVHDTREKVGSDGAVMFDAHSCLPPPHRQTVCELPEA